MLAENQLNLSVHQFIIKYIGVSQYNFILVPEAGTKEKFVLKALTQESTAVNQTIIDKIFTFFIKQKFY